MLFKKCLSFSLLWLVMSCTSVDTKHAQDASNRSRQATVHGSAPIIGADIEQARQAAIDDAITKASLQLRQNKTESLLVSDLKVVDEWQEEGVYHVQVLALSSPHSACQSRFRKRIVATAFPAVHTGHISGSDTQDLYNGIPREITNHLMESGDFIAINLTDTNLYDQPDLAPELPGGVRRADSVVLSIAKQHNAQLLLSGVIRDFKIESTEYVRGSGVLAMVKSAMRDYVARRSIGIDVYVYDGFTGAIVFQRRYTDSILGDVSLPQGYVVGSERFDATPAGHAIGNIVEQASDDIEKMFACYPFAARVDHTENGRIVIAAGARDGIRVGDKMRVYAASDTDRRDLGFTDPIGIMVITDIGPSMAVGQLEGGDGSRLVRPGDWVRSIVH